MKIKSLLSGLALAALCVSAFSLPAAAEGKKLYLYTWDTYVAPELFKKFEAETGIQIVTDIYSSNDTLLAKLKAGGSYDLIAPSGNYVTLLIEENLLQPLPEDVRKLGETLVSNVQSPAYDPAYSYVMPLFYGSTALAVNTRMIKEDVTSWEQYFKRPEGEAPSLGVLDDVATVMNLVSLALEKPFCDDNPETFKAFQTLLTGQKPFVKVYGATGYFERLAANEVALQMAWSGDVYKVRQQNPDIKYVYPKEGVELWADNLAIPATAQNVDAAKQFITFALRPENMALYSQVSGNMPSVAAATALLPEDMKTAPEFNIPAGLKTGVAVACPTDVVKAHNTIWERLLR